MTNIIIMGAAGRMGSTLIKLILQDQEINQLKLVAAVDPKIEFIQDLPEDCLVEQKLEDIIEPKASSPSSSSSLALYNACKGAVIIDFTAPDVTMHNARLAAKLKNPHIIGTTGISDQEKEELSNLAKENIIVFSPNMSVGVNVLLDIIPKLTQMLGDEYDTDLMEIHHNRKKDSPSGTALRLAEAVAEGKGKKLADVACYHREGLVGERPKDEIGIQTLRGGDVVGVHTVYYMGAGERIEITHQAHSRENFANGALRAARWVSDQKAGRLYTMHDVLNKY